MYSPQGHNVEGLDVGLVITNSNEVVPDRPKRNIEKETSPAKRIKRHRVNGGSVAMTGFQE